MDGSAPFNAAIVERIGQHQNHETGAGKLEKISMPLLEGLEILFS
jgi:hypothetical protein